MERVKSEPERQLPNAGKSNGYAPESFEQANGELTDEQKNIIEKMEPVSMQYVALAEQAKSDDGTVRSSNIYNHFATLAGVNDGNMANRHISPLVEHGFMKIDRESVPQRAWIQALGRLALDRVNERVRERSFSDEQKEPTNAPELPAENRDIPSDEIPPPAFTLEELAFAKQFSRRPVEDEEERRVYLKTNGRSIYKILAEEYEASHQVAANTLKKLEKHRILKLIKNRKGMVVNGQFEEDGQEKLEAAVEKASEHGLRPKRMRAVYGNLGAEALKRALGDIRDEAAHALGEVGPLDVAFSPPSDDRSGLLEQINLANQYRDLAEAMHNEFRATRGHVKTQYIRELYRLSREELAATAKEKGLSDMPELESIKTENMSRSQLLRYIILFNKKTKQLSRG